MPTESNGTRWIFIFYLGLLFWLPIPLGSNRPWSWAVLELWVLLLAGAWLVGFLRGKYSYGQVATRAWPVLLCMGAWAAYVWLQLLPLPIELLTVLSPQSAHWHGIAGAQGAIAFAPIALDRYAGFDSACKTFAYAAFFMLSLVLLQDRLRIRLATYALIASGVGQAAYGGFTSLSNPGAGVSGTFVNPNHYASYLVMALSVGIGVLLASLSGARNESWSQFFRNALQWAITPKMGLRLLLVVMVIGLVLSRSRMGNLSFFISLFVTGVIGLILSKKASRSMVVLIASLIVVDIFIVGAYFGTQRVIDRLSETSLETDDRDEVAGYALKMWQDFPVFGAGLGSFPVVFPRYSAEGTSVAYTHAHNDFLEFAAEAGAVGLLLLGAIVAMSFAAALRAQQLREDPVMRGISFASLMGTIALMIHSTVDFNLQIPANALTFLLLLAFGWISLYGLEKRA